MAKFRAINDYLTKIGAANFDHTNVNGLTGDPDIRKKSDAAPDGPLTNGSIEIDTEEMGAPELLGKFRHDNYFFTVYVNYTVGDSPTYFAEQVTAEMVAELDRLHIANNDGSGSSRTYLYNIVDMDLESTNGDSHARRILQISASQIYVAN